MTSEISPNIHLDHTHAQAVCQGIGDRLRDSLERNWTTAPKELEELFDRLPELDAERAPSIVPRADAGF